MRTADQEYYGLRPNAGITQELDRLNRLAHQLLEDERDEQEATRQRNPRQGQDAALAWESREWWTRDALRG